MNLLADAFKLDFKELQEKLKNPNVPKKNKNTNKSLITFISVNLMLFFINITTSPEHLWFIYPLLGWGIPLSYKRYKNKLSD